MKAEPEASARLERLVSGYRTIAAERMRGLPITNPHLAVEAVGFQDWEGRQIGVLIAPWFMNLVLLPGPDDDWSALAPGASCEWRLPSGRYQFNVARIAGLDVHQSLALFTTVTDFPDQATARAVAREIMPRLFEQRQPDEQVGDRGTPVGKEVLTEPVSRRGLLRRIALQDD
jgi:[NiFe] hydrogenase assembly HybE family chaperone